MRPRLVNYWHSLSGGKPIDDHPIGDRTMELRDLIVDPPAATTAGLLARVETVLALNAGERIGHGGELSARGPD